MSCGVIPCCHFIIGSEQWNQLSSLVTMFNKKSVPSAIYHQSNCDDTPMQCLFVSVHKKVGNPMGTNIPISHSHYHLLYSMVSHAKLCCNFYNHRPLVLFDKHVNFLLIVFSYTFWLTTAWLIGDVHVSVFKVFQ